MDLGPAMLSFMLAPVGAKDRDGFKPPRLATLQL
jgi:hypothetical protein